MRSLAELQAELTAVEADVQRLSREVASATSRLDAGVDNLDAAKEIAVGKLGAESVVRAKRAAAARLRGEIAAAEQAVRDARVSALTKAIDAKRKTLRGTMLAFCRDLRELKALETDRYTESQGRVRGNAGHILAGVRGALGILGIQVEAKGLQVFVMGIDQA